MEFEIQNIRYDNSGVTRLVVGKSSYSDGKVVSSNDVGGYFFKNVAFVVKNINEYGKIENNELTSFRRVLGMLLSAKKADEKIQEWLRGDDEIYKEVVKYLSCMGIYLANVEDDKENIKGFISTIREKRKLKVIFLGDDAIRYMSKLKYLEGRGIEFYSYIHPSPRNNGLIFEKFDPCFSKEKYNKKYTDSEKIVNDFSIYV